MTIGIPTCNRVEFLKQAIESAIAQSYPNVEIIVSDNASTDNTHALLARYVGKIRVILQNENIGMTRNWDACLSAATGEYFLLLSDDDFLEANAIECLVAGYKYDPDSSAFVYGRTVCHKADGTYYRHPVTPPDRENAIDFVLECYRNQRFASAGATLFRTAELRAVGGYGADHFNLVPDSSVMMKISLLDPRRSISFVDDVVCNYRVHSSNLTGSTKLSVWVDEIVRLSDITLKRLEMVAPTFCRHFLTYRDRYVVSFTLGLAGECPSRDLLERSRIILDCYSVCRPYLGVHSLKTFCRGALGLLSSQLCDLLLRTRQKNACV